MISTRFATWVRFLQSIACAIEENRRWVLLAISLMYFVSTTLLAGIKPLWNDELYTFYIAQQRSFGGIWKFLLTGADQQPPLFYIVSWFSLTLPIHQVVAIRLPEIVGFWVMAICLFLSVSRRSSTLWGLIAMLFPFTTEAWAYAYEARPYALVLGCAGLAWYSWTLATENPRRKGAVICLALALAGAVCFHYYSVLVVVALSIGEISHVIIRRRIEVRIWLAFSVSVLPLLAFLTLIKRAASFGTFWAKPRWGYSLDFYGTVLGPATAGLVLILVILGLALFTSSHELGMNGEPRRTFDVQSQLSHELASAVPPIHELVGAVAFIALPLLGIILAKAVTGAYADRYALPAVLGIVLLFCWLGQSVSNDRAEVVVALAFVLALSVGVQQKRWFQAYHADIPESTARFEWVQKQTGNELPIAINSPITFLEMSYYAPANMANRIFYFADPDTALRRVGHDWVDRGLLSMKQIAPLHVKPLLCLPEEFFVDDQGEEAWLVPELLARGVQVRVVASRGDEWLYRASVPQR